MYDGYPYLFGTCATFEAGGGPKKTHQCVPPMIRFGFALLVEVATRSS